LPDREGKRKEGGGKLERRDRPHRRDTPSQRKKREKKKSEPVPHRIEEKRKTAKNQLRGGTRKKVENSPMKTTSGCRKTVLTQWGKEGDIN